MNVGFHNFLYQREDLAQGSMHEKGLAFDVTVTSEIPWEANPTKETPDNLLEKIMNECATVDEAITYFHKYNCRYPA